MFVVRCFGVCCMSVVCCLMFVVFAIVVCRLFLSVVFFVCSLLYVGYCSLVAVRWLLVVNCC